MRRLSPSIWAVLAVAGLAACGTVRTDDSPATSAVFTLTGGTAGSDHPATMSPAAMMKMSMSGTGPAPGGGAYLREIPHGRAQLRLSGDQLTGWVRVVDLPPGSHHSEDLIDASASCLEPVPASERVTVLPDLVANAAGTARVRVDQRVSGATPMRALTALAVHRDPTLDEVNDVGSASAAPSVVASLRRDPVLVCGAPARPGATR